MSGKAAGKMPQAILRLQVQVMPNAKRTEVAGMHGDAIKIRLQAQPIEGKANDALIRFVADALNLPKTAVSVSHGQTSRRKLLEILAPAMTVESIRQTLLALATPD
jgi:hypothetical protein